MIRQVKQEEYSKVENTLFVQLGDASLEWLYYFETARDGFVVFSDESLGNFMIIFKETNVLIVTKSQVLLEEFLKKLRKEKNYGFRCPE